MSKFSAFSTEDNDFWQKLDQLIATSNVKIERPKGSPHPQYSSIIYPLDYGYLQDTQAGDGTNIDVWIGSLSSHKITGVICSVDLQKRDTEIKLLLSCTPADNKVILDIHNRGNQSAILLARSPSPRI